MNFEYLEETIVDQIQILAEELGGKMTKSTRCDSTGKRSKIISIEYDVTQSQYVIIYSKAHWSYTRRTI